MKSLAFVLAAVLLAGNADAVTLSFEQVLSRAEKAHDVSPSAIEAAELLESTPRATFPMLRVETSAMSAGAADIFARNTFRYETLTALLTVDYPLLDGGVREKQMRVAQLDAQSFRQRLRESSDNLFRETLEAVARLYAAQERLRILNAGLQRAVEMRERARQMLEMQEISNVTAAQWQDEAIVAESQLLDLELQRLEAETHVRQLMGDTSGEPLEIVLQIEDPEPSSRALALAANPDPLIASDQGVARAGMLFERKRLELQEAEAARRPQLTMSAFGGVSAIGENFDDTSRGYGLFGIRFTIALPMFDTAATRRVAEARLNVEQASLERRTTTDTIRRQTSSLWLGIASLEKRIGLIEQMVDIARKREESVIRLVAAGVRPENDVAHAAADRARRESDLVSARVELWKYQQIVKRRVDAPRTNLARAEERAGAGR
jgi:outer membrane protein TolC